VVAVHGMIRSCNLSGMPLACNLARMHDAVLRPYKAGSLLHVVGSTRDALQRSHPACMPHDHTVYTK
jgi:hypothetical protein